MQAPATNVPPGQQPAVPGASIPVTLSPGPGVATSPGAVTSPGAITSPAAVTAISPSPAAEAHPTSAGNWLIDQFHKGGPVMWPILIVSIIALTVVIERILWWGGRWFRRDPKRIEKVFTAIENGDVAEASRLSRGSRDPVLRMMWNGLNHQHASLQGALQVAAGIENSSFSFPEIANYRSRSKTIDQFVEFGDFTFSVLGRGEPHRATGGLVTANFFAMLGARPLLGRMLVPADEPKSSPPVVVLTYAYWQRMFGSDPSVVGQMLDLTAKKAEIVGVLQPGSHYATQRKQDFYVNYAAHDHYIGAAMQNEWPHRMTDVYARLAPGEA